LSGSNVFTYILGRGPNEGEEFVRLDAATQSYLTTTYKSGLWSNGDPVLKVGEAAFFKVVSVPEPPAAAFGLVGIVIGTFFTRRRSGK
jgi:hypothetical protein